MARLTLLLLACSVLSEMVVAAPTLKQEIFEFNSRVNIQEEFVVLNNDTVSDPSYSLNELRMQLDESKTYEEVGFYDKVKTPYGQAVAYNTLDSRWFKFKNKLLYFASTSASASKFETIRFRVLNPEGEASNWGEVRISLGGQYDQKYDYYPVDDTASVTVNQAVDIDVLQNDPLVQPYYTVEIYNAPTKGLVSVNADKTIRYSRNPGVVGADSFSYRVRGNNLYDVYSAPALVSINTQALMSAPIVNQFEWVPSVVEVGGSASFHWNIANVQGCYGVTGSNPTVLKPAAGSVGPYEFPAVSTSVTKFYCIDLAGNRFPSDPNSFLEATRTVIAPTPVPVVKQFEWVPSVVEVGGSASFHWNIENVQGCYGVTGSNPTVLKPAAGSVGPYEFPEVSTSITKFYCIDLAGNRFPSDPNSFLEATRTVIAPTPVPVVKQFEWVPSVVEVGGSASFHWNIENVQGCYGVTGSNPTVLKPAAGSVGPYEFPEVSTSITKFYCIDLAGKRFPSDPNSFLEATRNVVLPEQNSTTVIYIHTDILGSVIAESDGNGNVIKTKDYKPFGESKDN